MVAKRVCLRTGKTIFGGSCACRGWCWKRRRGCSNLCAAACAGLKNEREGDEIFSRPPLAQYAAIRPLGKAAVAVPAWSTSPALLGSEHDIGDGIHVIRRRANGDYGIHDWRKYSCDGVVGSSPLEIRDGVDSSSDDHNCSRGHGEKEDEKCEDESLELHCEFLLRKGGKWNNETDR